MSCRVIGDYTLKEGEIKKVVELLEGANGLQVTKDYKGCQGVDMSIDLDNPNRLILTGTWESREDHAQYIKFREDELHHKDIAYEKGATKKDIYSIMDKIIKTG